jgi:putative protease
MKAKIPELLAPAGSFDIALQAFKAGADAIYCGLEKFNARERTKNLSFDQMEKLVNHANDLKKKVYVTLNTLIKEDEFLEAAKVLEKLNKIQPHAIIIQDIGLLYALRKYFPDLNVHASTQMAIHNSAGVNFLANHGVERVILERQVTTDELRKIVKNSKAEIEVFIHGALCACISGSCLFSSWLGGWSGNRGKCKQPCRRLYFNNQKPGFFFSTKDFYSLEHIDELKKLNVASLKIEGRLRETDYVTNVIKAYRLLLDTENINGKTIAEAKQILSRVPARTWSHGFNTAKDMRTLISPENPGVQGKHCGKIITNSKNGFEVKATIPIAVGDKIRIQPPGGDEGQSITITKMTANKKSTKLVKPGKTSFIFCDKQTKVGWNIFKIGHIAENLKPIKVSQTSKTPLSLAIDIDSSDIKIRVTNLAGISEYHEKSEAQPAQKLALSSQVLTDEFSKTGNTPYRVQTVNSTVEPGIYLSQKDLKKIRQRFYEWLSPILEKGNYSFKSSISQLTRDFQDTDLAKKFQANKPSTTIACNSLKKVKGEKAAIAMPLAFSGKTCDEVILPFFVTENEISTLRGQIKEKLEDSNQKVRITSLFQFELIKKLSNQLASSFPLPITNSFAVKFLHECGVNKIQLWPELEESNLRSILKKCGNLCEILSYGRLPILVTRAEIPTKGQIKDKRGIAFNLQKENNMTLVLPQKVFSIPAPKGASTFTDLTHCDKNEKATYSFNFNGSLI